MGERTVAEISGYQLVGKNCRHNFFNDTPVRRRIQTALLIQLINRTCMLHKLDNYPQI